MQYADQWSSFARPRSLPLSRLSRVRHRLTGHPEFACDDDQGEEHRVEHERSLVHARVDLIVLLKCWCRIAQHLKKSLACQTQPDTDLALQRMCPLRETSLAVITAHVHKKVGDRRVGGLLKAAVAGWLDLRWIQTSACPGMPAKISREVRGALHALPHWPAGTSFSGRRMNCWNPQMLRFWPLQAVSAPLEQQGRQRSAGTGQRRVANHDHPLVR
jgi:hypothetical protein